MRAWHPFDSSRTRVCPAFEVIEKNPTPFFELFCEHFNLKIDPTELIIEEIRFADGISRKEKPLNPNPEYLKWMINHPDETLIERKLSNKSKLSKTDRKRFGLLRGACVQEAVDGIESAAKKGAFGRDWYVLEGATKPDVYIKTNKFYLIVEGKRTEAGPEVGTLWNGHRHQMVRHLEDLYFHCLKEKQTLPAYGIFIVRKKDEEKFDLYKAKLPWVESLPHMEDVSQIQSLYLGCLTWGEIFLKYRGEITYVERIEEDGSCIPYEPDQYDIDD